MKDAPATSVRTRRRSDLMAAGGSPVWHRFRGVFGSRLVLERRGNPALRRT